jgi:hypothetical protein
MQRCVWASGALGFRRVWRCAACDGHEENEPSVIGRVVSGSGHVVEAVALLDDAIVIAINVMTE